MHTEMNGTQGRFSLENGTREVVKLYREVVESEGAAVIG